MKDVFDYTYEHLKIVLNGTEITSKGYDLIDFKLNSEVNEHTNLVLKVRIKAEYQNEWDLFTKYQGKTVVPMEREIDFYLSERKYYSGLVQKGTSFERDDGDYIVELIAYSRSEVMDRTRNYRIYQNSKTKYIDIVKDILHRHPYITILGVSSNDGSENESVDARLNVSLKSGIVIQYDETDWEFLIRIMSHLGMGVYNTENGSITLGMSKNIGVDKQWNILSGNIGRGIDKYDNIYYELESQDFFLLGDNVIKKETMNMGYINKTEVQCIDGKFYGKYFLRQYEYWFDYIPNKNLSGKKIDCKVVKVPFIDEKEGIAIMAVNFYYGLEKIIKNKEKNRRRDGKNPVQLKAHLDVVSYDEDGGCFYFPYSTFYSKTNTGFFCTPEKDDIVPVCFESDEECEGYVGLSIDNPMSGRFSNPYYRNYTTHPEEGGENCCFEFSVSKENYSMECKSLYKETFLHKVVEAGDTINVNCSNTIGITSDKLISIKTDTYDVNVTSDYTELVDGDKKFMTTNLTEQISSQKNTQCGVYSIKAKTYKTKK